MGREAERAPRPRVLDVSQACGVDAIMKCPHFTEEEIGAGSQPKTVSRPKSVPCSHLLTGSVLWLLGTGPPPTPRTPLSDPVCRRALLAPRSGSS